jgi:hypothetical protein
MGRMEGHVRAACMYRGGRGGLGSPPQGKDDGQAGASGSVWLDQISAIAAALGFGRLVCWRLCVPRGWITASLSRKQRLLWLHEIAVRVRAPFNRSRVCVGLTEGGSPKMGSQACSTIAEGRERGTEGDTGVAKRALVVDGGGGGGE